MQKANVSHGKTNGSDGEKERVTLRSYYMVVVKFLVMQVRIQWKEKKN
jgi:hypothetical protein